MAQRCLQVHALAAVATAPGAAPPPLPPPNAPDALPPLQSTWTDGDCRAHECVGQARQRLQRRTQSVTRVFEVLVPQRHTSPHLVHPLLQPLGHLPDGVPISPLLQSLQSIKCCARGAKCVSVAYPRCFPGRSDRTPLDPLAAPSASSSIFEHAAGTSSASMRSRL